MMISCLGILTLVKCDMYRTLYVIVVLIISNLIIRVVHTIW